MGDAEVQALRRMGRTIRYDRGRALLVQGQRSDQLAIIESGRVKISVLTEDGEELVLAIRGPGEVLGELSAVDGKPRSATAVAVEPVVAVVVSSAAFLSFVEQRPASRTWLISLIAGRLRDADIKRVAWIRSDSATRLIDGLAELAEEIGQRRKDGRSEVPISQQELAAYVGMSREAVSRALRPLRERGLVATARGRLIVDLETIELVRETAR